MARLRVRVVYALAGRQEVVELLVGDGATAREAAAASRLGEAGMALGIGGHLVSPAQKLRDGDRVEILRRLEVDPREARRRRARRRKQR